MWLFVRVADQDSLRYLFRTSGLSLVRSPVTARWSGPAAFVSGIGPVLVHCPLHLPRPPTAGQMGFSDAHLPRLELFARSVHLWPVSSMFYVPFNDSQDLSYAFVIRNPKLYVFP